MWTHNRDEAEQKGVSKGTPGKLYPDEGVYNSDNSKSIRDLGLSYRSLEEMLGDAYRRYKELQAELN